MASDDIFKSTVEDFAATLHGIDPHAIFARTIKIDGEAGRKFVLNIQVDGPDIVTIMMLDTLKVPLMAGEEEELQLEKIQRFTETARIISIDKNEGVLIRDNGRETKFTVMMDANVVSDLTEAERNTLNRYPLAKPVELQDSSGRGKTPCMPFQWTLWSIGSNGYEISVGSGRIADGNVSVQEGMGGPMIIRPSEPTRPPRNSQFQETKPSGDVR